MTKKNDFEDLGFVADNHDDLGFKPEESTPTSKKDVSIPESLARGAAQGVTMGFADEIAGGAEAIADKLSGDETDFGDLYRKHRDESRKNFKDAEEANPTSSTVGNIAGGLAGVLLPGAVAGKGGAALTKLLTSPTTAGKAGALLGATTGLGNSEADITKGEVLDAAEDAAKSGVIGGAMGTILPKLGPKTLALLGAGAGYVGTNEDDSTAMKAAKILGGAGAGYMLGKSNNSQAKLKRIKAEEILDKGTALTKADVPSNLMPEETFKNSSNPLVDLIKDTEIGGDILRSREIGKTTGNKITGSAARERMNQEVSDTTAYVEDKLNDFITDKFNKKLDILKKADEAGKKVNFNQVFQEAINELDDAVRSLGLTKDQAQAYKESIMENMYAEMPETVKNKLSTKITKNFRIGDDGTKKLVSERLAATGKGLTPEELLSGEGIDQLQNTSSKVVTQGRKLQEIENLSMDEIKEGVMRGEIGLEEAAKMVRRLQQTAFEKKQQDPTISRILKNLARKASDQIENTVPETAQLNAQMSPALDALEQFGQGEYSRNLGRTIPSKEGMRLVEKYGQNFGPALQEQGRTVFDLAKKADPKLGAELEAKVRQQASDFNLGKRASTGGGISLTNQILGSVKDIAASAANFEGRGERAAIQFAKEMTPESVKDVATKLSTVYGEKAAPVINTLTNMLSKDERGRNALMFSIMQNPEYREMLGLKK